MQTEPTTSTEGDEGDVTDEALAELRAQIELTATLRSQADAIDREVFRTVLLETDGIELRAAKLLDMKRDVFRNQLRSRFPDLDREARAWRAAIGIRGPGAPKGKSK